MCGLRLKTTTDRPDRLRDRRDIFTEICNGAEIHLRNAKRSSIPHQANGPRPQHAKSTFRPREIQRLPLRPQLTNAAARFPSLFFRYSGVLNPATAYFQSPPDTL